MVLSTDYVPRNNVEGSKLEIAIEFHNYMSRTVVQLFGMNVIQRNFMYVYTNTLEKLN